MKIGFILCEHPLDVRIKKEARSLAAAGHEVVAIVQERNTNQTVYSSDALTVHTHKPKATTELARGLFFFTRVCFLRTPLESTIEKFARSNQIDAIHVHDLPNSGTAIRVGRKLGIPVVSDLHENYPAAVRAWVGRPSLLQMLTTNQALWTSFQKRCVHRADKVIVVIEEMRDLLLTYGVPKEKVFVVPNYVDLDYLNKISTGREPLSDYAGKFVVSYIGHIGPHRGVDVAIKAMAHVAEKASDVVLVIVGGENDYTKHLHQLIDDLKLQHCVQMVGWQPFERVPDFVAASNAGLVPHQRNPHCDNTIPNKLFDYMGFSKPVIVSDAPPLVRITNDAQAGLVFKADNPFELAECILQLYENTELAKQFGLNGAAAVKSYYNWGTSAAELVKVYETLSR